MKKILFAIAALVLAAPAFAQNAAPAQAQNVPEMTEAQKTMYFLGWAMFGQVQNFDFTAEEQEYIIKGFTSSVKKEAFPYDPSKYNQEVRKILESKYKAKVDAVKAEGKKFVANEIKANKKNKPQTLKSGVVYIETLKGKGKAPKETDIVKVHYHGTFADGKVFDSSVDRGQPAEFPLNGVVKCWTEGVQKMKVGGKAILLCPSDTAYGDNGVGPIPGGATLKFEIELLDIVIPPAEEAETDPKK